MNTNAMFKSIFLRIVALLYLFSLFLFVEFSTDGYSMVSRILAWLVFVLGTLPTAIHITNPNGRFPVVELVLLAYVNAFSLPVFFESQNTLGVKTLFPDSLPVALCLVLVLVAILSLQLGFRFASDIFKLLRFPALDIHCSDKSLFRYALLICFFSIASGAVDFGEFGVIVGYIFPIDMGIAILAFLYYSGDKPLGAAARVFSIVVLLFMVLRGLGTGTTQAMLQPLFVWFICRWLLTRKIPILSICLLVGVFILTQPVKLEYRDRVYSDANYSGGIVNNISLYSKTFSEYWFSSRSTPSLVESNSTRTSLLLQTSHVIDWTPDVVPFMYGETLKFMLVTWIPRFLWPNKPTAQQANIDYAINYGVTSVEGTLTTMFGAGQLADAFMNFGPIGLVPIYLFIGMLTYLPIHLLKLNVDISLNNARVREISSIASSALMVAALMKFVFIGSSISDAYGGVVQLILIQWFILHFVSLNMNHKFKPQI